MTIQLTMNPVDNDAPHGAVLICFHTVYGVRSLDKSLTYVLLTMCPSLDPACMVYKTFAFFFKQMPHVLQLF